MKFIWGQFGIFFFLFLAALVMSGFLFVLDYPVNVVLGVKGLVLSLVILLNGFFVKKRDDAMDPAWKSRFVWLIAALSALMTLSLINPAQSLAEVRAITWAINLLSTVISLVIYYRYNGPRQNLLPYLVLNSIGISFTVHAFIALDSGFDEGWLIGTGVWAVLGVAAVLQVAFNLPPRRHE